MTSAYLRYELQDGYIHNWLVLGPRIVPLEEGAQGGFLDLASDPVVEAEAAEPASVDDGIVAFDDYEGHWQYVRCSEDHFVDLSGTTRRDAHLAADRCLVAWAYAELEVPAAGTASAVLTMARPRGAGAADIWVNRHHIHHQEVGEELEGPLSSSVPQGERFSVSLAAGRNIVLVRFEVVAMDPCAYAIALQIRPEQLGGAATVCLPTAIASVARRELLERVFYSATMDRYVLAREDEVMFRWPSKDDPAHAFDESVSITARLRARSGRIYAETDRKATAGSYVRMGHAYQQLGGAFDMILMPRPQEYYEHGMRFSRAMPLWSLGNNRFTEAPSDTLPERRRDALISAARYEANVYSEVAKMAVGWSSHVDVDRMVRTLEALKSPRDCDYRELLGYLGMVLRFGEAPEFPEPLRAALSATVTEAAFPEAPDPADPNTSTQPGDLVAAACEILAGQLYPENVWASSGRTGDECRHQGERLALAWMRACAAEGLGIWLSDTAFEEIILVLAHLIEFSDTDEVWQMATVLLDKLLFQLAVNSFKGVFGASRGTTSTTHLFGGHLDATSGITKLLWGAGVFNFCFGATVSLACLTEYAVPLMFQAIALEPPPDGLWSRERHAPGDTFGAGTVTYKTVDGMLSSVLDYRPGEPGAEEHVWQATLGPGATVFVTHPVCSSLDDARRPNFWRGNGVLPRVAQWRDALIALYALPDDDWMGFTHAYFPVYAFDEHVIREGWAFARKGDGYLALTASGGVTPMHDGVAAYRELRSEGHRNIWLCQMGRAALDTDFATFQEKVLALPVVFDDLVVRWTTLRGDTLAFDWTGPLLRNNEPTPLTVDKQMENPYCVAESPAQVMDIRYGDVVMRLRFVEEE